MRVADLLLQKQAAEAKTTRGSCKALECLLCERRYSRDDVARGLYWIETFTCSACYAVMQAKSRAQCCFGKADVVVPVEGEEGTGRVVELGYSPTAPECSQLCPDRKVCSRLFQASIVM